jgi:uncharacterized protein
MVHADKGVRAMKVLVSGGSGLVGSALIPALHTAGHEVFRLVRRAPRPNTNERGWNPETGEFINPETFEGLDAVIHLAGENIAEKRWTPEQKALIESSRVQGTQKLAKALAKLKTPPKHVLCASAIGYYGAQSKETHTEVSAAGTDFLARVCRQWEAATEPLKDASRIAHLRFGVILSKKGGALAKMLPIFKLGGGGPLGHGQQYMSWIALDDVVGAIIHVLNHPELTGPINVTAPTPVTNASYTRTLGSVLCRPAFAPVPRFAVKLMFGEMGDALLLSSSRVLPVRLQETGFKFQYADLRQALKHVLK